MVEEGETVEVGASLLELDGDSSSPAVVEKVKEKGSSEENNINEPVKEIIEEVKVENTDLSPAVKIIT